MLSTERPIQTELNWAELHTSCAVFNALEIKSRDRQHIGAAIVPGIFLSSLSITQTLASR